MGRADRLRVGGDFILKINCTVLAVEPISPTHVRVKVTLEDQPSLAFVYENTAPLEFVCRNGRGFNSTWWPDDDGGGGGDDEPVDPPSPNSLEPVF
ncbi:MAG: hypothetical protein ACLP4V_22295 [Methylocella sp.]